MNMIFAPGEIDKNLGPTKCIFLAGSIEMGVAEGWQEKVGDMLEGTDWTLFNPRRKAWDNTWEQTIQNGEFRKQVEWELDAMEYAQNILMYYDPNTKSPITLLELGLLAKSGKNMFVVSPKGFWRRGNIEVVCNRFNIPLSENLEQTVREHFI